MKNKIEMPSMSLAKRIQEDKAKRDEAIVEGHGSTGPLRLEKRRRMASRGVKALKEFVLTLRTQLRAAQASEIEILDWEKKNPAAVICKQNNLTEEQEQQRRDAMRSQRAQQLGQIELMIMDYNSRADIIDSNLLNFDATTVRMVKTKKSDNKKGMFRNTAAMSLFDIASMLEVLCQHLRPDLYPPGESDEERYEPEDDFEIVTEDEDDEEEETPKGKAKNGTRSG